MATTQQFQERGRRSSDFARRGGAFLAVQQCNSATYLSLCCTEMRRRESLQVDCLQVVARGDRVASRSASGGGVLHWGGYRASGCTRIAGGTSLIAWERRRGGRLDLRCERTQGAVCARRSQRMGAVLLTGHSYI